MADLELRVKYPAIVPRRYCVVIQHPHGKLMLPPDAFFIGDVLAAGRTELATEAKEWFKHRASGRYRGLFNLSAKRYTITINDRDAPTGKKKILRRLDDFSPADFVEALESKIRELEGSYNLWRTGGESSFLLDRKQAAAAHTGTIVLSGRVKSKSRGFREPYVEGPFQESEIPFNDVYCTCPDFRETTKKQGYENIKFACVHVGGLLAMAVRYPEQVRNLRTIGVDKTLFVPFHADGTLSGDAPNEDNPLSLKMDVLVERYLNRATLYSIDRALAGVQSIFDPLLVKMIPEGKATFEVLAQKFPFAKSDTTVPKEVKELFSAMSSFLGREGYALSGYAVEKKDSPWEAVAVVYTHKDRPDSSARVLVSAKYPPVLIMRSDIKASECHFPDQPGNGEHPFAQLYHDREQMDDVTRRETSYRVRIPSRFPVHGDIRADYRAAIESFFPSGCGGFEQKVVSRIRDPVQRENLQKIITAA